MWRPHTPWSEVTIEAVDIFSDKLIPMVPSTANVSKLSCATWGGSARYSINMEPGNRDRFLEASAMKKSTYAALLLGALRSANCSSGSDSNSSTGIGSTGTAAAAVSESIVGRL